VSKSEAKETRVEIRLPKSGYPKTMFFNRFRVERQDEFYVVLFGLLSASGSLLDQFSSIFPRQTLDHNQKSLLEYLERLGQPKQKAPFAWQGALQSHGADVVDIVSMAFRNDMAETCLCVFSLTAATRVKPGSSGSDVLEAQPLVLLRSSLELQQQLIVALYEE